MKQPILYGQLLFGEQKQEEGKVRVKETGLTWSQFSPVKTTEHWVKFPMQYSRFSLVTYPHNHKPFRGLNLLIHYFREA